MGPEWSAYCSSLERWVDQQHELIATFERHARNAFTEQTKLLQADWLAREFYQREMERFLSRAPPQGTSAHGQSSTETRGGRNPTGRLIHRYIIPHPWRRIIAELIDMSLVLVIKLLLMYNLTGSSPFLELSKYISSGLLYNTHEYRAIRRAHLWTKSELRRAEFSLHKLLWMNHEDALDIDRWFFNVDLLLIVDHLGRLIGAFIEAVFISYAFLGQGPGGATLGKWLMNLQVVACDDVISHPDAVEVSPGTNTGLARALVRSMLKSTSFLTMFSFVCMLLFRYHRCTYDIIAGTLVVQPVPAPRNREENRGAARA